MREVNKGNTTVLIYDSIEELPATLHSDFNIAILEDENIGQGIESIEQHNRKILDFLVMGNSEYALEQAKNQNFCIQNTKGGYNAKRTAFCHLIHSINGVEPATRNAEFLAERIKEIDELTIEETVNDLKKNSILN